MYFYVPGCTVLFRAAQFVFYDIGQDIFHVQSGSLDLLWNETGSCHARSGIDLQHVDFFGSFSFTVSLLRNV